MKTYVIIGVGGRSMCFTNAISVHFKSNCKLLAVCDNNSGRLNLAKQKLSKYWADLSAYSTEDFDLMLKKHSPDYVIVSAKDCDHLFRSSVKWDS